MDPRVKPEDDGWRPGLFLTHLFDVTAKRSLTNHAAVRPAPFQNAVIASPGAAKAPEWLRAAPRQWRR
jgi:arginase family enzyme